MAKDDLDLTSDLGMTAALNLAYAEFERDKEVKKAITRSGLIGRGIAIRNLRLREAAFRRGGQPGGPPAERPHSPRSSK